MDFDVGDLNQGKACNVVFTRGKRRVVFGTNSGDERIFAFSGLAVICREREIYANANSFMDSVACNGRRRSKPGCRTA